MHLNTILFYSYTANSCYIAAHARVGAGERGVRCVLVADDAANTTMRYHVGSSLSAWNNVLILKKFIQFWTRPRTPRNSSALPDRRHVVLVLVRSESAPSSSPPPASVESPPPPPPPPPPSTHIMPSHMNCCFNKCTNSSRSTQNLSFHKFPTNESLWVEIGVLRRASSDYIVNRACAFFQM